MIEALHIHKRFGPVEALDGVSLVAAAGERVAVIGPHGAGKSTLLRVLAGVWPPDRGLVRLGGFDLERDPVAARRLVGYLPETTALPPDMRVGEYLRFRAQLKGLVPRAVRPRVRDLLSRAGLRHLEGALAGGLSRGEARLVVLLDAVVHYPEIVLLDEPFVGFDADGAAHVRRLLDALPEGRTVVLAGHRAVEAQEVGARVIALAAGRVAAGVPHEEGGPA